MKERARLLFCTPMDSADFPKLWSRDADEDYEMPAEAARSGIMFPKDAMSYHFAKPVEHRRLPWDGGNEAGQISAIFHTMARPWDIVSVMPAA